MSDLTDLEVCQKIADITVADVILSTENSKLWINKNGVYCGNEYNPLTDDALCFKFAVNDKMMLSWVECPAGSGKAYFVNVGDKSTHYHGTPNRAVCMAKLKVFRDE